VCEVKKGTYPVNPGSNLNFGSCALVIDGGATIQLTTAAGAPVTIEAASLTMDPSAQILGAPGAVAPNDGGIFSITVSGAILLDAGAAIVVDAQDATISEIDLTAGGPITLAGKPGTASVSAQATTTNGSGGTIILTSNGDVTVDAAISAAGGQQGGGGTIWITTTNAKVMLNAPLDASGGEFDGGCIDIESDLDLMTASTAKLSVDGGGLSGSGGLIMLNSNVQGAVTIGGPVSGKAAGSSQNTSEGGGDGGELDSFTNNGGVTVNAPVTLPGGTGGGGGGTIDIEPIGGDLLVTAPLSLPGSGMGSCGGTATLGIVGTGNVSLPSAPIDVSGDSCGGGSVSLTADAGATVPGEINADSNGTTLGGGFIQLTAGTLGVGGKVHANGGGGEVNFQACTLTLSASGQALATGPNGFNLLQASGPMEVDGTLTATSANTLDYLDPSHLPVVHSNHISPTAVIVHDNPPVPPLCPGQTTTTTTNSTTTTTFTGTTTTTSRTTTSTTSTSTTRPTTTTTSSTTTTRPTTTSTSTTTSTTRPPFGGDDTGFVPPAKSATAKCETGASKVAAKLAVCIAKCHDRRAAGKLIDDTAEDACEKGLAGKSCAASFAVAIAKLKGCPACISGTTMATLAMTTEAVLDANNGSVYCDRASNQPFGGDDTGFVPPPKSATAKCETGASKAAAKLVACIFKCHDRRASGKLKDATHEEECETTDDSKSCRAKFVEAVGKLKACPTCINPTSMAALEGMTEAVFDANNGSLYCASPSGAFVE
jgi:hypothetical protein